MPLDFENFHTKPLEGASQAETCLRQGNKLVQNDLQDGYLYSGYGDPHHPMSLRSVWATRTDSREINRQIYKAR